MRSFALIVLFTIFKSSLGNLKIINGELARDGDFPHMVQLSIKSSSGTQYCGGTLLNDQWVLTAAHCFRNMLSVKAYLGSAFWRTMPVKMKISKVIVHPKFVNVNAHDIALVKLERKVNFTENIKPAELPKRDEKLSNSTLLVAGFGETKNASQSILFLRFVKMREITNEECEEAWYWKFPERQLCAVGVHDMAHTTCSGDSGSGLVVRNQNSTKVLGIVSYGTPGCVGKPKVFTRVSSYLDFIQNVIEEDDENSIDFN